VIGKEEEEEEKKMRRSRKKKNKKFLDHLPKLKCKGLETVDCGSSCWKGFDFFVWFDLWQTETD